MEFSVSETQKNFLCFLAMCIEEEKKKKKKEAKGCSTGAGEYEV